uniref:Putative secreted protein n=1 Tax=Anopheles darlingi TaxID=43151 RepID=A0A2M4DBC0_ANODA
MVISLLFPIPNGLGASLLGALLWELISTAFFRPDELIASESESFAAVLVDGVWHTRGAHSLRKQEEL